MEWYEIDFLPKILLKMGTSRKTSTLLPQPLHEEGFLNLPDISSTIWVKVDITKEKEI
jgi:hypothetical protein